MATCAYCNTSILFGGVKDGSYRFCNAKCHENGQTLILAPEVPDDLVDQVATEVHMGLCPKCSGPGPIDVYTSHSIYSIIIMSSWESTPQISCRSCGRKSQILNMIGSLLLGWWGIPWGIIMTPVQVGRNFAEMLRSESALPSEKLKEVMRMQIAAEALEESE